MKVHITLDLKDKDDAIMHEYINLMPMFMSYLADKQMAIDSLESLTDEQKDDVFKALVELECEYEINSVFQSWWHRSIESQQKKDIK